MFSDPVGNKYLCSRRPWHGMGVKSILKDLVQSNSRSENGTTYIPLTDTTVLPPNASHIDGGHIEFQSNVDDEEDDDGIPESVELEVDDAEREKLRRVADSIPIAAFTIVLVEFCERFAFYGLSGVFQNYLQNPLPPGGNGAGAPASPTDPFPAGALGLGQRTATILNNSFGFLAYAFSVVGAVIADSYWGRYKTISMFCLVYVVGLIIITFTSFPLFLAGGYGLLGWGTGAIVVAIGTGGIKGMLLTSSRISSQLARSERVTSRGRSVSEDSVDRSHPSFRRTRACGPDRHHHTYLQPFLLVHQCRGTGIASNDPTRASHWILGCLFFSYRYLPRHSHDSHLGAEPVLQGSPRRQYNTGRHSGFAHSRCELLAKLPWNRYHA